MAKSRKSSSDANDAGAQPPEGYPSERELVLITQADVGLRATGAGLRSTADADVSDLEKALGDDVRLVPLFGLSEERITRAATDATTRSGADLPDMARYYHVAAPDEKLDDLAEKLRDLDAVEAAYVKPPAYPPIAPETEAAEDAAEASPAESLPASPDFSGRQGYLDAAPGGIDARYAWTQPGGLGTGIKIIDIEGGWNFSHEDLTQNQGGIIGGTPSSNLGWRNHGTAVIGEFGGDKNGLGIEGIAPDANTRAISIFPTSTMGSAKAIRQAADALSAGDIILIELHRPGPRFNYAPRQDQRGYIALEWWPDDYAAIRYAASKGVIVVEAAGNGAEDLDDALYDTRPAFFPSTWTNPFNPSNPSSNAVVVGAGAPPPGTHGRTYGPDRSRLGFSNYGARVDAQGWGREVTTTGGRQDNPGDLQGGSDENLWYTDTFSGTSSASPIVVGALACVQGVLKARGATLLTPTTARSRLRATGSPQQDAPGRPKTQRIGNRPNLRQLIPASCTRYRLLAIRYYRAYRRTRQRRYLCGYYRYLALYYRCLGRTRRRYRCYYYRYLAAYYRCRYQETGIRRYLCYSYRAYALFYRCRYLQTRNPSDLLNYRRFLQAYRRCRP